MEAAVTRNTRGEWHTQCIEAASYTCKLASMHSAGWTSYARMLRRASVPFCHSAVCGIAHMAHPDGIKIRWNRHVEVKQLQLGP